MPPPANLDISPSMSHKHFYQSLSSLQRDHLREVLDSAFSPVPKGTLRFWMGPVPMGWLNANHVDALLKALPGVYVDTGRVCWDGHLLSATQRSQALALAAHALHADGLITGWRNECYSYWGCIASEPDPDVPEWFRVERAAYRFFGLRSHAVHVNGFTSDGRMWCARRSLTKATDPGRLDNLAAGGLSAGERVLQCAVRELYEEAGLSADLAQQVQSAGRITTARMEPQGWHEETLVVYNLHIPDGVRPRNIDGEVSEFVCLTPNEVIERIQQKDFSNDAACVIAKALC